MMPADAVENQGRRGRVTRRRALGALAAVLAGLPLAACGRGPDPAAPPAIRYGEDTCAACGMIVSEPAHAAAYRTAGGEVRLFDDLGEMVLYHRRQQETVAFFFVHDVESKEWLRADDAFYVASPDLRTPMGGGVVALASEPAAQALAGRLKARIVRFPELLDHATLPGAGRMGH